MGTLSAILSNTLLVTLTQNSFLEGLEEVSLKTLLGILIVLAGLILIILLIYMFRIFPHIDGKKKEANEVISSTTAVITSNAKNQSINLTDNLELVAVITAAISASMGEAVPADGLVVRSIRKVNKRR